MVNTANRIYGRQIDKHPLATPEGTVKVYRKGVTVLAVQAQVGGVIETPEGELRYQAGDYILTDNPPTHAWPVREQVFLATYSLEEAPPFGALPLVPEPAAPALSEAAARETQAQQEWAESQPAKERGEGPPMRIPDAPQPEPTEGVTMAKQDMRPGIASSESLGMTTTE